MISHPKKSYALAGSKQVSTESVVPIVMVSLITAAGEAVGDSEAEGVGVDLGEVDV